MPLGPCTPLGVQSLQLLPGSDGEPSRACPQSLACAFSIVLPSWESLITSVKRHPTTGSACVEHCRQALTAMLVKSETLRAPRGLYSGGLAMAISLDPQRGSGALSNFRMRQQAKSRKKSTRTRRPKYQKRAPQRKGKPSRQRPRRPGSSTVHKQQQPEHLSLRRPESGFSPSLRDQISSDTHPEHHVLRGVTERTSVCQPLLAVWRQG